MEELPVNPNFTLRYDLEFITEVGKLQKELIEYNVKQSPFNVGGWGSTDSNFKDFKISFQEFAQNIIINLHQKEKLSEVGRKCSELLLMNSRTKTRSKKFQENKIDDKQLKQQMILMIPKMIEFQKLLKPQNERLGIILGKLANILDRCINDDAIAEQKTDQNRNSYMEMIDTSSLQLPQLMLLKSISSLQRTKSIDQPKFKIGSGLKIVSKYLLIEIASFAFYKEELQYKFYSINPDLRLLLIQNTQSISIMSKTVPTIKIDFEQNDIYFFKPHPRIFRYELICSTNSQICNALDFLADVQEIENQFNVSDNIITYTDQNLWSARDVMKEMNENIEDYCEANTLLNYNLPARRILDRNPSLYDIDPKFVFNQFTIDFRNLHQRHAGADVFNFDKNKPMKNKIQTKHLIITNFQDTSFNSLRIFLTLYFMPLEQITIQFIGVTFNSDSFFRVILDFFDPTKNLDHKPHKLNIEYTDSLPTQDYINSFNNLKINAEKSLKVQYLPNRMQFIEGISNIEVDKEKQENVKSSDQLKMYLSAKGKSKFINLSEIKMDVRESKFIRMLKAYEKFIDRETEELIIERFIPGVHSILLGHILECCKGLKLLQINFQDFPNPLNHVDFFSKWEQIDFSLLNSARCLTSLIFYDKNCTYRGFTKYLMNGLKHNLTFFQIKYSNPDPYRHSQYLREEIISELDVNKITKLHVQDFEQIQDTIHLFTSLKELYIEDLNTDDVPRVMELVGQQVVKEGYVDPMAPKPKVKKPKKKKNGEEEIVEEEPVPKIEYQILRPVRMPSIEVLGIDVVSIQSDIYSLEYPHLKTLQIKILEAPKFQDCVIALSKNLLRKGTLLKIITSEEKIGLKPSSFQNITRQNPDANIELSVAGNSNNGIVFKLLTD